MTVFFGVGLVILLIAGYIVFRSDKMPPSDGPKGMGGGGKDTVTGGKKT
jgi:hypothetical protein